VPQAETGRWGAGRSCDSRRLIVAEPADGERRRGGWTNDSEQFPARRTTVNTNSCSVRSAV